MVVCVVAICGTTTVDLLGLVDDAAVMAFWDGRGRDGALSPDGIEEFDWITIGFWSKLGMDGD